MPLRIACHLICAGSYWSKTLSIPTTLHAVCALALFAAVASTHAATREIKLADATTVGVEIHPAPGSALLLWLPTGLGRHESEQRIAEQLAALRVEVWRADLLEARFLPALESSLGKVPDSDVAALIAAAHAQTGKRVYLLASARAATLALRGALAWQTAQPRAADLGGLVLLHPNVFEAPPEPGREAVYHPAVARTSLPVYILQPERSPWRWRLDALTAELEKGGARASSRLLPGVRDRYYFRPDADAREEAETARLPQRLHDAIAELAQTHAVAPRKPAPVTAATAATPTPARVRELKPYKGEPTPPALALGGIDGKSYDLAALRGRVVLVNFWASWCPPCVREMPSMQRLQQKMADQPFTILAVNMGESETEVRAFLDRIKVEFPILLDRDGAALKRWKVFVFPTSFVLGADGEIRYALFGELEWDRDEVVQIVEGLLPR